MASPDIPNYCPECGAEASPGGRYCSKCGADILAAAGRAPEEPPADEMHVSQETPSSSNQPGADQDGQSLLTRRRVVIGGGALAFGAIGIYGLSQLSTPEHRVYGKGWDIEQSTGFGTTELDGSLELPAGRYAVRTHNPSTSVEYEIEFDVVKGGPIDVFVTDDDEYDRYRNRDPDFQVLMRAPNSTGERLTGTVSAGDYRIVFDNTGVFGASPDGDVRVELSIIATVV